eukprot:4721548-Heterocapsa_arctica.AAC.1
MIIEHLKQKEDEIKHKGFCVDEFNENQPQMEQKVMLKQFLIEETELAKKGLEANAERGRARASACADAHLLSPASWPRGDHCEKQKTALKRVYCDET